MSKETMKLLQLVQSIEDEHQGDAAHDSYRGRIETLMGATANQGRFDPDTQSEAKVMRSTRGGLALEVWSRYVGFVIGYQFARGEDTIAALPSVALDGLPSATPADMLDVLSVMDPKGYRGLCTLLQHFITPLWDDLTRDEQIQTVAEVDRRRAAVAPHAGRNVLPNPLTDRTARTATRKRRK